MPAAYDRLPLGALRVFEAVATHLSFSAAAEALNVTPAAVSQQIKALEAYIQVPLFRRSGRRVEITDEGLELLPAVRVGLEKLESALQQIKHHGRAGPLQISHAVIVSADLAAAAHPLVSAQISQRRVALSHLARAGGFLAHAPTMSPSASAAATTPNLHSEKFLDDWLVPVASPDLIKQYGMIERGSELEQIPAARKRR